MYFTQEQIDNAQAGTELHNNPDGGTGLDYTQVCSILEDNQTHEPIYWQSGEEGEEGFEKHKVGIEHERGTKVSYILSNLSYSEKQSIHLQELSEVIRWGIVPLRPMTANHYMYFREKYYDNYGVADHKLLFSNSGEQIEMSFSFGSTNTLKQLDANLATPIRGTNFYFINLEQNNVPCIMYTITRPWDGFVEATFTGSEFLFCPRACANIAQMSLMNFGMSNVRFNRIWLRKDAALYPLDASGSILSPLKERKIKVDESNIRFSANDIISIEMVTATQFVKFCARFVPNKIVTP